MKIEYSVKFFNYIYATIGSLFLLFNVLKKNKIRRQYLFPIVTYLSVLLVAFVLIKQTQMSNLLPIIFMLYFIGESLYTLT